MKYLIVIATFLYGSSVFAQELEIDPKTGLYTYETVIQSPKGKSQIFNSAMEWVALKYVSANDVIQLSNQETGKIICKGNFVISSAFNTGYIKHTLVIDIKEGRYKLRFSNLIVSGNGGNLALESKSLAFRKKFIRQSHKHIINSVISIKKKIDEEDEEW